MSEEPREKRSGETMSDCSVQVANELPMDAVCIWQIVPGGRRDFGLEGDALTDYVRRCIAELLSRSTIPGTGGGTDYFRVAQKRYGSEPEKIIDNVVREWLAKVPSTMIPEACGSLCIDVNRPFWNRTSGQSPRSKT